MLFTNYFENYGDKVAFYCSGGREVSYRELHARMLVFAEKIGPEKRLVALECANEIESLVAYLAAIHFGHPVILFGEGKINENSSIFASFPADVTIGKNNNGVWEVKECALSGVSYHEDLCILLSTSGTTGSAKLVRLSRENIQHNTMAIVDYLKIDASHTSITTLPFHYSYGMSVINSHLAVGASIVLTDHSVADDKFWRQIECFNVNSFAGVPYTFEILEKRNFREGTFSHLRYITQAGGRLPLPLAEKYTQWSKESNCLFYIMYGQTEASPRVAYVPPESLDGNEDCIGIAIPGGELTLIDENSDAITSPNMEGELVYHGPNVMMGYALRIDDLALAKDDKPLRTGDLAVKKENGLFKIVGRKSRFSKLFGLRISLDEVEVEVHHLGISSVVVGNDDFITIAIIDNHDENRIISHLSSKFKLNLDSFYVMRFDEYPILPSGKIDQRTILALSKKERQEKLAYGSLLEAYQRIMNNYDIRETDSFVGVGGDSLLFVAISIAIEDYLGFLPDNWEGSTIEVLEALKKNKADIQDKYVASNKKAKVVIAMICLLLILGELFLQVRTYLKTGRSAFTLLSGESTTVFNEQLGVKTYRPNLQVKDAKSGEVTMSINEHGLRSEPIDLMSDKLRIAILGASTVAGAYAKNNAATFPYLLNEELKNGYFVTRNIEVEVVNAGIEGHILAHTKRFFDGLVSTLSPDIVVLYPGFNDISLLCRADQREQKVKSEGVGYFDLPDWVLSKEMIRKNTTSLRNSPVEKINVLKPAQVDASVYGNRVKAIIESIIDKGMLPALMTVSRVYYNVGQQDSLRLAEESLYYYQCLDSQGLIEVGELYNHQIRKVGKETGTVVFDLAESMPGGKDYFVDGGHFTFKGESFTAQYLAGKVAPLIEKVDKQMRIDKKSEEGSN